MVANSPNTASQVWFLVGPYDSAESVRYLPIYTLPFVVGRRQGLALSLNSKTVSTVHAEISETASGLVLRDLDSTNGTYVNGQRVSGKVSLQEEDLVQFANVAFRVRQQSGQTSPHTVQEDVCDRALALVQFDKLMAERAVTPFFQPIIEMTNRKIFGYEILARSRLFGLETPKEMFDVASQLNLEIELSVMLRFEGVQAAQSAADPVHLFVNTHPRELSQPGLLPSLVALRESFPDQPLTLEIHETAVTDPVLMREMRAQLSALRIGLAYDDFGAGQSRLNELIECPPDYLKFDMSLIREIDSATPQRQQILATLVQMARSLGIVALAEGVETEAESAVCLQMGFELGQGFLYGKPSAARKPRPSVRLTPEERVVS